MTDYQQMRERTQQNRKHKKGKDSQKRLKWSTKITLELIRFKKCNQTYGKRVIRIVTCSFDYQCNCSNKCSGDRTLLYIYYNVYNVLP